MPLPPRNLRLTLAYDGSRYVGWQIQPNGVSVQQVVLDALRRITGETDLKLLAAGRTDAGVHALAQETNFVTTCSIPTDKFRAALQTALPRDIVVRRVAEVPESFHATYSAIRKCYRYVIHCGESASPFLENYCWRIAKPLDLAAMEHAARALIGTHDFRCFESHFPNKATSVRTIETAAFRRAGGWTAWSGFDFASGTNAPDPGDEFLLFEISADGFLYNMVRAIVGTLVDIGRGRFDAEHIARTIASGNRSQAGPTAPPQGLYLVSVDYDLNNLRSKFTNEG